MRKLVLVLGTAAAIAMTTPSFSMGGGGGGGGYSGGGSGMGGASFDDYAVAVRLIKHEKYADAIPHLLTALSDRPHSADILNYLGYSNRMLGQYPQSLAYYQRALTFDPDHKGVHEYLGELYLQMHDLPSAQHELDTLASLCPSGCDERDTLTKAVAAYAPAPAPATQATPATAPAAPATPAAPTGG
ncbi:MAG TPA: tetratricopeptide repeat protein [Rhizomicrobium sp.]|jgi:predicted Zn-dependent protease|nr:tetratricopeptide repeat protein [Rhizomicrobium sp.]